MCQRIVKSSLVTSETICEVSAAETLVAGCHRLVMIITIDMVFEKGLELILRRHSGPQHHGTCRTVEPPVQNQASVSQRTTDLSKVV